MKLTPRGHGELAKLPVVVPRYALLLTTISISQNHGGGRIYACIKNFIIYQTTLYYPYMQCHHARHILPSAATVQASLPTVLSA